MPVIIDRTLKDSGLASVSITVKNGSVNEPEELNGVSHFIEHLVFKGTKSYSCEELSGIVEQLGGYINAYTSKEQTSYYIKGFSGSYEKFIDILLELVFFANLTEEDFKSEKRIILSEIATIFDQPDEYLHEETEKLLYKDNPISMPISGTKEHIDRLDLESLKDFYRRTYVPANCIISVSGDVDKERFMQILKEKNLPMPAPAKLSAEEPKFNVFRRDIEYKSEQAYVNMVFPACRLRDDERFELSALNLILGGLMSSRLFVRIRENLGLCYHIESDIVLYEEAGYFQIAYNCEPQLADTVEKASVAELKKMAEEPMSEAELMCAKNQMKYSLLAGLQTVDSIMFRNLKQLMYFDKILDKDELLLKIDSLRVSDIMNQANRMLNEGYSLCRLFP